MTLQADFASQDYFRNPAAAIEKLRASGPVVEVRFPIIGKVWGTTTEPDHNRLRDIVDEAFRRRAVLDMEPHIQALGDQLADELFAEGSPADLVERYARKLPLSVISELLGLPLADRPKFIAWASGFTRFTGALGFLGAIPNLYALKRYLERHLETVRAHGGEGLIAEIVRVEKEGGHISPN